MEGEKGINEMKPRRMGGGELSSGAAGWGPSGQHGRKPVQVAIELTSTGLDADLLASSAPGGCAETRCKPICERWASTELASER
jgi:hypothetical protein